MPLNPIVLGLEMNQTVLKRSKEMGNTLDMNIRKPTFYSSDYSKISDYEFLDEIILMGSIQTNDLLRLHEMDNVRTGT